ncbi:MAG: hypothetical protein CMF16_02355 [Idiomarina sp.]|jgi:nitrogen fixation/metabolism regulation signal transduction histidine kinase|nr:hypothetical protein [Haliea sp.]MAO67916.1 hypothetical protein [Idiomarina sp.]MBF79658.1 hypothetical protein [Idiomarina sp.]|tara:strand:- start:15382 stop:16599 length:1218 start_codon:yes stop_codon:yes gene_type:complete
MRFLKITLSLALVAVTWRLTAFGGEVTIVLATFITAAVAVFLNSAVGKTLRPVSSEVKEVKVESRSQNVYENFFHNMDFAAFAIDASGKVLVANRASLRLLGLRSFSLTRQLAHKNSELYNTLMNVLQTKSTGKKVCTINTLESKLNSIVNISAQKHGNLPVFHITITDIHDFLEQEKHDSWERLIEVLTHEIMNSITPISSLASSAKQLVPEQGQQNDDLLTALEVIERRSDGLLAFVEKYKGLTNLPPPSMVKVDLGNLIESVVELSKQRFNTGAIKAVFPRSKKKLTVSTDPSLLEQVLLNVIKNALEASSDNSSPLVTVTVTRDNLDYIAVNICDNGSGISAQAMQSIFLPFFTTKQGGSGIGLAISKQICHLLGCTISASQSDLGGANVSVTIPTVNQIT